MKKYIPRFASISFLVLAFSYLLFRACLYSSELADAVNGTASFGIRYLFARLSHFLPFSFFELLVILSPVILVLLIVFFIKRGTDRVRRVRFIVSLLAIISLVFTSYLYTLAVGYHTTPIAEKIGVEDSSDISTDQLYITVNTVVDEINALAENIALTDGETRMPYLVDELSEKLVTAYDSFLSEYPIFNNYSSRVKPIYFSTVMSDFRISGIYTFFTGEANVNVEYPDYCLPFVSAHEMAHQRGISRENEANFVAFLVAIGSDDEYIRYSGYLNIYEYLASALYRADSELYYAARDRLSETAIADMRASNEVYKRHKDSILGKINERLNDAYLKANGTDGVVSYNYVVRLTVGYYEKMNNE